MQQTEADDNEINMTGNEMLIHVYSVEKQHPQQNSKIIPRNLNSMTKQNKCHDHAVSLDCQNLTHYKVVTRCQKERIKKFTCFTTSTGSSGKETTRTLMETKQFFTGPRFPEVSPKNKSSVVLQPPYSPLVSPAVFFLLVELKDRLTG